MSYEKGISMTELDEENQYGVDYQRCAELISEAFSYMIFDRGFLHCDPHAGNIIVRQTGDDLKIVLLDHGLYSELSEGIRLSYTKLWRGILTQNEDVIKEASREIVGEKYYKVFTTMIVAESFENVMDKSKQVDVTASQKDAQGKAEMKDYAMLNSQEILEILSQMPSDIKLILKTTYYLKAVYERLGNPVNSTDIVNDMTWNVYVREWDKMEVKEKKRKYVKEFMKYWTLKMLFGMKTWLEFLQR